MLTINPTLEQSLTDSTLHLTTCWEVECVDGTFFRLTNYPNILTLSDGNTYQPTGGWDATATDFKVNILSSGFEARGVLDSSMITEEDLRAGKYRDAKVTEHVVDARWSWVSDIRTSIFWILRTRWDGERWMAEMTSLPRKLRQRASVVISRNCKHTLGDSGCGIDLTPLTLTGKKVTAVFSARQSFKTDIAGEYDDYFQYGKLTWTTGNNTGLSFMVQRSDLSFGKMYLVEQTPYDIAVDDEFSIYPGCNRTAEHCQNKTDKDGEKVFDNFDDFGGFPTVPGSDRIWDIKGAS